MPGIGRSVRHAARPFVTHPPCVSVNGFAQRQAATIPAGGRLRHPQHPSSLHVRMFGNHKARAAAERLAEERE
jgi:hypothetical protein